jgi:hypothetical protein
MSQHELLIRIARQLNGIDPEDLTKAETNIVKLLIQTGYMNSKHEIIAT